LTSLTGGNTTNCVVEQFISANHSTNCYDFQWFMLNLENVSKDTASFDWTR